MSDLPRIRALLIPVDARPWIESVELSFAAYQRLVGGVADRYRPCDAWQVWFSDMYRALGAEANHLANTLVRQTDPSFAVLLRGPVMMIGADNDGNDTDIPNELLRQTMALLGMREPDTIKT